MFTFPRSGQTEDWVEYLGTVPQFSELTLCYWITPSNVNAGSHVYPVSYATASHDNQLLTSVSAHQFQVYFKQPYAFDSINFQDNRRVRK